MGGKWEADPSGKGSNHSACPAWLCSLLARALSAPALPAVGLACTLLFLLPVRVRMLTYLPELEDRIGRLSDLSRGELWGVSEVTLGMGRPSGGDGGVLKEMRQSELGLEAGSV